MEQIVEGRLYPSLDVLIAQSTKPAQVLRALAVKNDLAGIARSQIGLLLGRSVSFVSKWRLIYDEYGTDGLISLHQGGRPRAFLTEQDKEAVLAYLQAQPTMSLPQLREYLQSCYGIFYRSDRSYYALLHQAGFTRHKSQKANARPDPILVTQKRKTIKKNSGQ
jgi:putative transposase